MYAPHQILYMFPAALILFSFCCQIVVDDEKYANTITNLLLITIASTLLIYCMNH